MRRRRVTSAAGEPPVESERASHSRRGGERRPREARGFSLRFPIALKFALMIALLTTAFMGWQTMVSIDTALPQLDRQVNRGGTELAATIAKLLAREKDLANPEIVEKLLARVANGPGSERILNAVFYDAAGAPVATARGESTFRRTLPEPIDCVPAALAGVAVGEFDYEGVPVRSFRCVVSEVAGGDEPRGQLEVYLSATDIAQGRAALTRALITVSTGACLAAALGAFLLARLITRPIRTIVKDMRCVSQGDLHHQSNVSSSDELGDLAHTFNVMTRNLLKAQDLKVEQRALEHELALATEIQTRLLPETLPELPGFDIAAHYASAQEVGGDYYDFVPVTDDHLGLVVADVSGKGVPAALVMTMTRSLLRFAARGEPSPIAVMRNVHQGLAPDLSAGLFVTLVYAVIDRRSGRLSFVRCGHNAPYLYRADRDRVFPLAPKGIGVGIDRSGSLFARELEEKRIPLRPGDALVFYTDGVVEAKNAAGADYGDDRLATLLHEVAKTKARSIVESIVEDVQIHRGRAAPSDDLTVVVIRRDAR